MLQQPVAVVFPEWGLGQGIASYTEGNFAHSVSCRCAHCCFLADGHIPEGVPRGSWVMSDTGALLATMLLEVGQLS